MPTATQTRQIAAARTLVGWQGIRFTLPPDWNITGFSLEPGGGYLKVESPGTMFAQVKWTERGGPKPPLTLYELTKRLFILLRLYKPVEPPPPDLRAVLDNFLKETSKHAKKARTGFDFKVKPETKERGDKWTTHNFTWSGGGQGQGKIWHCSGCGRVVIAQIVGQARDNVADVAAGMFGSLQDHAEDGWNTWALYDVDAQVPADFKLRSQKLMSGYIRLDFWRGAERILLERWGLANVTRKKFTLEEWFRHVGQVGDHGAKVNEVEAQGHPAVEAGGSVRGLVGWLRALRDAAPRHRPATRYAGSAWECPETNKIFMAQTWTTPRTERLLEEVVTRCRCHGTNV